MRQKVALIAKIRAIESVPVIRFKVSCLIALHNLQDVQLFSALVNCVNCELKEANFFNVLFVSRL